MRLCYQSQFTGDKTEVQQGPRVNAPGPRSSGAMVQDLDPDQKIESFSSITCVSRGGVAAGDEVPAQRVPSP